LSFLCPTISLAISFFTRQYVRNDDKETKSIGLLLPYVFLLYAIFKRIARILIKINFSKKLIA
jgi:hypothetical protein